MSNADQIRAFLNNELQDVSLRLNAQGGANVLYGVVLGAHPVIHVVVTPEVASRADYPDLLRVMAHKLMEYADAEATKKGSGIIVPADFQLLGPARKN